MSAQLNERVIVAARGGAWHPTSAALQTMGHIKLLTAPVRSIVRFPLFQLAVVVGVILFLQAGDDKSARGQMFNGLDKLVESTVDCFRRHST